jgi:hypothetical protein
MNNLAPQGAMSGEVMPFNDTTPNLGLNKPLVGGDDNIWGDLLNANADTLDTEITQIRGEIQRLTGILLFIGSYDAAADHAYFTNPSGLLDGPLPPASAANFNTYLIVTTPGMGTGNAPPEQLVQGDWLVSDGIEWEVIPLGIPPGGEVAAANVTVTPAVLGANDVQAVLEELLQTQGDYLPLAGGTMLGSLNFTATGSTTSRSVQVRAAEVRNPRDFGAVGDGVSFDSAAIQRAADAIPAIGGTLYLSAGIYRSNATVVIKSNTMVLGDGPGTVLLADASWSQPTGPGQASFFRNLNNAVTSLTDYNITVRDLQLDYGMINLTYAPHAIFMWFVRTIKIINVLFECRGRGNNATALLGCYDMLTDGCSAFDFINCAYDHWHAPRKARVVNCYAETGADGAQMVNFNPEMIDQGPASDGLLADGLVLANNHFKCTFTVASPQHIEPLNVNRSVRNVLIADNIWENCYLAMRGDIANVTISGNLFNGALGGTAVIFASSRATDLPNRFTIAGNQFINPTTVASELGVIRSEGIDFTVIGNTIAGPAGSFIVGISLTGIGQTVHGNRIVGAQFDDQLMTGGFTLSAPDNTPVGGNRRGNGAADLQVTRITATQVASGNYSFVACANNTASGPQSAAFGNTNVALGAHAFAAGNNTSASGPQSATFGQGNTASGNQSFAAGLDNTVAGNAGAAFGTNNTVSSGPGFAAGGFNESRGLYATTFGVGNVAAGDFSTALGHGGADRGRTGCIVFSSGDIATGGDIQIAIQTLCAITTNATPVVATTDRAAPNLFNVFNIPDFTYYRLTIRVVAKNHTTAGNAATWQAENVLLARGSGAASTYLSAVTFTEGGTLGIVSGWSVSAAADITRGGIAITCVGHAVDTVHWGIHIESVEVQ